MPLTVESATRVRNDLFRSSEGLDRGRPFVVEAAWYLVKCVLFLSAFPFPSGLKRSVLRAFGARVGRGVVIKPRVNIHFPWKLAIGDHTWIGEEVFLLNLEPITVGSHCCISQRAFLCTGNHDYSRPEMSFRNRAIVLQDGAWIGAQVFVGPGVIIGVDSVITAGSVVVRTVETGIVCGGNPCRLLRKRWP